MAAKTILIIDDNSGVHEVFRDFFETKGYVAAIACDGREGLDAFQRIRPDIVLMDARMPVMNGYESSKGIKSVDPDAKILMITGHPADPLAQRSLREGYVASILSKPCSLDRLFDAVQQTSGC